MKKYKVIKSHQGFDNCINNTGVVELNVGDILTANSRTSNNRGHRFFQLNDSHISVQPSSYHSRHPYDEGIIDTNFLQEVQ